MTIHPSLKSGSLKRHRSVLKRHERIKMLKEQEKWDEDDSAFGLPKVKILRIKVKKGKAAEAAPEAEGAAAAGTAAETAETSKETPRAAKEGGEKK